MQKIKNNKISADVWCGMEIQPNAYYEIQNEELSKWQNDSKVLTDIGSGDLICNDGTNDILDVATAINFLKAIDSRPKDADGAQIVRAKAAKAGWVYGLIPVEVTTATLGSVYSKNADNSDRGGITLKLYNANNEEITDAQDETSCVKTVVDFEPTFDYEIIGGSLQQRERPTSNVRIWVIAVPDIPAAYGGSKEMICGANLRFIDPADKINADGRASKYMQYSSTYHTNKLRLIIRHDAGIKHDLVLHFEVYRQ